MTSQQNMSLLILLAHYINENSVCYLHWAHYDIRKVAFRPTSVLSDSTVCSPQSCVSAFTQTRDDVRSSKERTSLENIAASDIGVNFISVCVR